MLEPGGHTVQEFKALDTGLNVLTAQAVQVPGAVAAYPPGQTQEDNDLPPALTVTV